jgi:hypothetical protein
MEEEEGFFAVTASCGSYKCPSRQAFAEWRRSVQIYCGDFDLTVVAARHGPEVRVFWSHLCK